MYADAMDAAAGFDLRTPIERVPGVTARRAPAFRALGIEHVAGLLQHLPHRHEFEAEETSMAGLQPDAVVSARGEVTATRVVIHGKKRFEAVLSDDTGRLDLVWFNALYMRDKIMPGVRLRVQGKARRRGPGLQIANPRYEIIDDESEPEARAARLRPVYPASEEAPSKAIERAVDAVLDRALPHVEDHLSDDYRRERSLPSLRDAYRMMHRPESEDEVAQARRRLAYDEFLLLQLGVQMKRAHLRKTQRAPALRWSEEIDAHIRERFPFALTPAQDEVVREIRRDLTQATPSNRLIQGDVGSGKTVVALYAMLMASASRFQSALMAPTEILAEQHHATMTAMLHGSNVRIALLTGALGAQERRTTVAAIREGAIDIVIGTHALLTEDVRFGALGVVVIDEQHRFGVRQRAGLRERSGDGKTTPHTLVMTATPIPRTLALTVFGDLDVSTIRGMPPGRIPVTTRVVGVDKTDEVYGYVRTRLERKEQAYVVVPAIDTGESSGDKALRDVRSTLKRLEGGPLAGMRLAALHGRLKRETRERIMERFRLGQIDALVATTVIEVGVDVPNASIMVIEHAERFGLSQLHQLRGRVGRGQARALCVLIGEPITPEAAERLGAIGKTTDGFALAEKDLELRGPGEVLGARQAGDAPFRVADLPRDIDLLMLARRDAAQWIERSPTLDAPEETLVRGRLLKRYRETLGLADVG
ncbi:MAG: ATP-dependent DNA helicase RecG [Phycisphaerales bacterium]|nr:MAG: ATP-dependent DNA helicase RecG [Phycisphaerales bacterium]